MYFQRILEYILLSLLAPAFLVAARDSHRDAASRCVSVAYAVFRHSANHHKVLQARLRPPRPSPAFKLV